MCHGCQEYLVTREIEIPTVATTSRTTVLVRDRIDSHGKVLTRDWLAEPKIVILFHKAA